jgi:hypothetical protein
LVINPPKPTRGLDALSQRLVYESVHAEHNMSDGAEGAIGIGSLACIPSMVA